MGSHTRPKGKAGSFEPAFGAGYSVTFNIRDKGKEQYQYLIEFKENKTLGLSNTAVNNLLRTDQASYISIIPDSTEKINPSDEKSAKKSRDEGSRFALTDEAYLAAVESGDMDTVRGMVDEAAKKAGYTVKGYHGSHNSFTVFDEGKSGL